MANDFSLKTRQAALDHLATEAADLVVVGGGITGAGIAWEAALRGLKVVLLERGDFASGTSSKSSKLLHGGLRYLEHGEFPLVFESLAMRNRLFLDAPHVAQKLDFLFPIFRRGHDKGALIGAGLWLYDGLSALSDFASTRWHRRLSPAAALSAEPSLRKEGLERAFAYTDGLTEDARLVIETIKSAVAEGAVALSYVEVTDFLKDEAGRVTGVVGRDRLANDREVRVRARRVLNAAGPWVDRLLHLDDPAARRTLRPTKGVHLVTEAFVTDHAVVMRSEWPGEKEPRVMFVIPYGGRTLIGTTDTDPKGPAGDDAYLDTDAEASPQEVAYILAAVNKSFDVQLTPDDVISVFAGWRPLIAPAAAGVSESATSREHALFTTPSGLIAIAGGKLTAFRAMARQAVAYVVDSWGPEVGRPTTRASRIEAQPLSGSELAGADFERYVAAAVAARGRWSAELVETLVRRYGTNWPALEARLAAEPSLAEPLPGLSLAEGGGYRVEVAYAVECEGAASVADFLMRRTRWYLLDAKQGLDVAPTVAELMASRLAALLGWDAARAAAWREAELAAYAGIVAESREARQAGGGRTQRAG